MKTQTLQSQPKPRSLTHTGLFAIAALLLIWIIGCRPDPIDPNKLCGTWQLDVSHPSTTLITFNKNNTYDMAIVGQPGSLAGKWALNGRDLTLNAGSFSAYNTTATLPAFSGINPQTQVVVKLTDEVMIWRQGPFSQAVQFKRVKTSK